MKTFVADLNTRRIDLSSDIYVKNNTLTFIFEWIQYSDSVSVAHVSALSFVPSPPQTSCWSVRLTCPPHTSSAENHVRALAHLTNDTIPVRSDDEQTFDSSCVTSLASPLSSLSVQGDKEPASSYSLHRAGPQPLQVSGGGLHQVVQEGQPAALPHQVLPLRPAAGRARQRAGGAEVGWWFKSHSGSFTVGWRKVVSNAEWGCCRRKRSSSKGSDFVSDMKSEEQSSTCHRDDREPSAMETGRTPTQTYILTVCLRVFTETARPQQSLRVKVWLVCECDMSVSSNSQLHCCLSHRLTRLSVRRHQEGRRGRKNHRTGQKGEEELPESQTQEKEEEEEEEEKSVRWESPHRVAASWNYKQEKQMKIKEAGHSNR